MSTEPPGASTGPGSSSGGGGGGSRLTQTNSVTPGRDADAAELPSAEDRVAELLAERPELARTPLAGVGTTVRSEVADGRDAEPVGVYDEVFGAAPDPEGEIVGTLRPESREEVRSVTVAEAVYAFLRSYEESRGATVYLEKTAPDGEVVDTTEKSAEGSFAPWYRKKRHAQLKGFEREIVTDFEEPVAALAGLTASGVGPNGQPRPPADHMREVADAWSKSGGVRETLRNRLESGMGLEPDEWAYIRGGEPHPGDGPNRGYHHDHPAVVIDAARLDGGGETALRSAVEAAVRTHVEECPTAGPEAHENAVERVERVDPESGVEDDEITEVGAYVGSYIGGDYEEEPPEEPLSAVVWEATAWATGTQKFTAGRTARAMITADRCRGEAERGDHGPHGAKLRCTTDAWGRETVECAYCGSTHDTPETHEDARRSRAAVHRGDPLAESGDSLPDGMECGPAEAVGRVGGPTRERWCGHGWGGANECPLCAEEVGAVAASVPIPLDAYDPALLVDALDEADPRREPEGPPESVGATGPEWREPSWTAVEWRPAEGEPEEIGAPGSVSYRTVDAVRSETARRQAVGELAERCVGEGSGETGDAESGAGGGGGRVSREPDDRRRVVIDAVRSASGPVTTESVVEKTPLEESVVVEVLDRLRTHGRVVSAVNGYVPAD